MYKVNAYLKEGTVVSKTYKRLRSMEVDESGHTYVYGSIGALDVADAAMNSGIQFHRDDGTRVFWPTHMIERVEITHDNGK